MKINIFVFSILCLLGSENLKAQEIRPLSLKETIHLALKNSNDASISANEVVIAENTLRASKASRYPDVTVSGQYKYLTNAEIDLQIRAEPQSGTTEEASASGAPEIHQLLLGQAAVSMPLFAGFKLKNSIHAAAHNYQAQIFSHKFDKGEISLYAVKNYLGLYKAEQTVKLVKENLKSASQRVKDFTAMEKNGLLARNDLLKAELQKSNVELTLEEAKKNKYILNYRLVTFLKLPSGSSIAVEEPNPEIIPTPIDFKDSLMRGDLNALHYKVLAAEDRVKIAKGNYFPSISLSAGYISMDIQNAITVKNAMNIGVGISYNFSDIFKNKNQVRLAKSKVKKLEYTLNKATDRANIEVENARKEYQLALKKFEVYTKSQEQAIENYRIVKDKYNNGLQDTNDLLEADVQQLRAKMELAYAKADIVLAYYELQKAQGILVTQLNNNK